MMRDGSRQNKSQTRQAVSLQIFPARNFLFPGSRFLSLFVLACLFALVQGQMVLAQSCQVTAFTSNLGSPVFVGTQVIFEGQGTCGRSRFEINGAAYGEIQQTFQGIIWQTEVFGAGSYQICFANTAQDWNAAGRQCVNFIVQAGSPPPAPVSNAAPPVSAASSVPAAPVTNNGGCTHVVQQGQTLFRIAEAYGIRMESLAALNGIQNPSLISTGLVLQIPGCGDNAATVNLADPNTGDGPVPAPENPETNAAPDTPETAETEPVPQGIWTLSERVTLEDIGLALPYPAGWVFDVQPGLLTFAPDNGALAQELDPEQTPAVATITFNLVPLEAGVVRTIDDMLNTLAASDTLDIQDERPATVMHRQAYTLIAGGQDGRGGFATFWLQDNVLFLITLNLPDIAVSDGYTEDWHRLLDGIAALPTETLGDLMAIPEMPLEISYPEAWEVLNDEAPFEVGDMEAGVSARLFSVPLRDLDLAGDFDPITLLPIVRDTLGMTQVIALDEYRYGERVAFRQTGSTDFETWLQVWVMPYEEEMLFIVFSAPDLQTIAEFQTTWHAIYDRMQVIEPEADTGTVLGESEVSN